MATVKVPGSEVNEFLANKQSSDTELSREWSEIEELYSKKLWHQLTLKLLDFIKKPKLQTADHLIQLYNVFIHTLENKINPLSLVEIVAYVVPQYKDKKEAIAFLQQVETKVKRNDEALALCKVLQGQIYLEKLKDVDATEKIIEEIENKLIDANGITPVHGRFYKLASEYYRVRGPMGAYYRAALRYVGCMAGGADLPQAERRAFALHMALAAVVAPDVYDLGELLAHPIMENLNGTSDEWARELLKAVANGDVVAFENIRASTPHTELHRLDRQLKQKIAILCLMGMAFRRTSPQRKLTFSDIAREARISHDEVELLVMKALAEKLIRGHIDQVNETVKITWVKAQALDRSGAGLLAARLDTWCSSAAAASHLLANNTSDILTL
ncbi:26S proteasome non-ATPase regulatory subunit 13 [Leptidea sinapis]|uniref:26S proteasome non-ATPase regulatory subunit 13 n=1 Tax=Leptidea sinapis TaxID=189913 RepID=A0A5E4R0B4_9NEOP|nr:26S proteasome non-ATPase regulatory subunit 13 [Leptidea sinapis]VVD03369.1 unnamed protein product [Leptidea sinapis]